jgi:hypothetical protein
MLALVALAVKRNDYHKLETGPVNSSSAPQTPVTIFVALSFPRPSAQDEDMVRQCVRFDPRLTAIFAEKRVINTLIGKWRQRVLL